ncbi:rhodanese-like domain-containing protein [Corynebacterium cystitidis]|uniref:rhodanese-like domain-containing protein n=1 Tax=Corynebacterium cystitidis TaxID=35757 RepID=UPI00211E277E|nr:rhodanese-like domain-containing protein [Corynebacterium cystitidis]
MKRLLAATTTLLVAGSLAACSTTESAEQISSDAVILDVRTAEEIADSGLLDGAQHYDFNSGELATALPQLDPDAEYGIYCRSGNRAGQAKSVMEDAGFTDVTNLGSLQDAVDTTGLQIVKP